MSAQALTRPIPPHIEPKNVVDYDIYNDHRYAAVGDLHEGLNRLAEEVGRGIFWTPHNGGHWFVNDHEMIFEAVRNPEIFSNTAQTIPPLPEEPKLLPLFSDPPIHMTYRLPLMKQFAPGPINKLEESIRAFCAELIEAVAAKGRCEFVDAISEPMPIITFMKFMGMPLDRMREFRNWIYDLMSSDDDLRAGGWRNIRALMDVLIKERQAQRRDDLISRMLDAKIDDRAITLEEMHAYCIQLFAAGLDTVANSLAFAMNHLAGDAPLQNRLRANPDLIPEAVEEMFRKYAVAMSPRTATRDVEFHGVHIKKGERVLMMLPAGNLDPKIFPDPTKFDLDRENKAHITFMVGPHRCIGSHLARLEMRVFLEEWFKRMPNVRHDPKEPPAYRAAIILALKTLPLVWDRAA